MQHGGSIFKDLIDQQLLKQQREQLHQRMHNLAQSSLFNNPDTHLGQQQLRTTNPATHQVYQQQQQSVLDEDLEDEDGSEDIAEALLSLQGGGNNQRVSKRMKMEANEVYAGTGSSWPTLQRIATLEKPLSPQMHSPSESDQTPYQKSRNNSSPNQKFSDRSVKEAGGIADEGSDDQATASGSSKNSAEDMMFDGICEHQTEDQQDMAALKDMDQEDMAALEDMEISVVSDTEKGCQVWLPPIPGDYERRKQQMQGDLLDNGRKEVSKRKLNVQEVPHVHGSALGGASQGNSAAVATSGCGSRSSRCIWTPELHDRFVESVKKLGVRTAVPKAILQMMGVSGMTRENVASHLQKYRLSLRRNGELTNDMPSFGQASVTAPTNGMVGGIGKLHFVAEHQKLGLDLDSASGGYICSNIPLVHTVGEPEKQHPVQDLGPDKSLNGNKLVHLLNRPPVQMQSIQPVIQGQDQIMAISQSPMLQYLLKGGQGMLPHGSMVNMVPGGQLLYPVILQGGGIAAAPNLWQSYAGEPDQTSNGENGEIDRPHSL